MQIILYFLYDVLAYTPTFFAFTKSSQVKYVVGNLVCEKKHCGIW
jgi:hypothetical protein